MYAQDYDEMTMPYCIGGGCFYVQMLLNPYTKNKDMWKCPSRSTDRCAPTCWPADAYYGDMGYNCCAGLGGSMAAIKAPAAVGLFFESYRAPATPNNVPWFPNRVNWIEDRHMDGANLAYCDGHVKWNKIEKIRYLTGPGSGIFYADGIDR